MGEWTIQYDPNGGNVEKTLRDWGLSDLNRTRVSQGMDSVELQANGRAVDALELFDYGKTVIVYKDRTLVGGIWTGGTRWFYGRVDPWDRSANGEEESTFGMIAGPWWYLANKVFEQVRNVLDHIDGQGHAVLKTQKASRIVLGQKLDASGGWLGKFTVSEQMSEIINWAISEGAPIQLGTIDGALMDGLPYYFPMKEIANITCEEAIRIVWRYIFDAVFYWDYSTTPFPTLHMRQAANLTPITYAIGNPLTELRIKERKDWKRPFVRFIFEQINNGHLDPVEDIWPNPLPAEKFGGMTATVPLIGFEVISQSADLKCAAITETDPAWWKRHLGWLAADNITSVVLKAGSTKREVSDGEAGPYNALLVNELQEPSTLPDWLSQFSGQKIRVTAKATILQKDGSKPREVVLTADITATDAVSGHYDNLQTTQYGDTVPVGLAKRFYDAFNAVFISGSFSTQEVEAGTQLPLLSGALDVWHTLNFSSPTQPGWASVNALPQQIEEQARTGIMRVNFGAPEDVSVGDLVDALRVMRGPLIAISVSTRPAGIAPGGATPVGSGKKPLQYNSETGLGQYQVLAVTTDPGNGQNKIIHDAEIGQLSIATYDASGVPKPGKAVARISDLEGQDAAWRWYPICINGQQYKCKLLGSVPIPV